MVTTAAVLLFVIGGLRALFGLLIFALLLGISDQDVDTALYALALVLTVVTMVAAGLQIAGGVGCLRMSRRGYKIALTGTLLGLGSRVIDLVVTAAGDIEVGGGTILIAILVIAADVVILVTLNQNKAAFTN